MKLSLAGLGAIPILLSLAALAAAQTPSITPPPENNGLWQTEVTATSTGVEKTPQPPHVRVMQYCMTPESWKNVLGVQSPQDQDSNCKRSNFHQDSHRLVFDMTCGDGSGQGSMQMHFDMSFDDAEHVHGSVLTKMQPTGMPHPMTMNTKIVSHYISASCGDVKPGDSRIIKK